MNNDYLEVSRHGSNPDSSIIIRLFQEAILDIDVPTGSVVT
jgi:hypothetical protein